MAQGESYVGIDVAKEWLDVGTWPGSASLRVGNDAAGIAQLVERLRVSPPRAVVLEASGGFEALVASELHAAGLTVAVVNPRRVREFARRWDAWPRPTGSTRWYWRSSRSRRTATGVCSR